MNGIPINRQHNIRDPSHTPVQLSLETYNGRFLQPIAVSKARSNLACTPNGTVMFPVSSGIVLVSWKDRWTTQEACSRWQVQVQRSSGVRMVPGSSRSARAARHWNVWPGAVDNVQDIQTRQRPFQSLTSRCRSQVCRSVSTKQRICQPDAELEDELRLRKLALYTEGRKL